MCMVRVCMSCVRSIYSVMRRCICEGVHVPPPPHQRLDAYTSRTSTYVDVLV